MKPFRHILCFLLAIAPAMAQAATPKGLSCDDAIPVDLDYKGFVPSAGTYWYTAWTYDLPLTVHFIPVSDHCTTHPVVEVDFTCSPGLYDDPKLADVINSASDWNVTMPMRFQCDLVVRDGKNEFDLSIAQKYRDQLASLGITYNVQAFVKVIFPEGGTITLQPDTVFRDCLDRARYIGHDGLPDTLYILPRDSDRTFVMPYADWQNDSIQFTWLGKDSVRIFLATTECNFTPDLGSSGYIWDYYDVFDNRPYKLQSQQMQEAIKSNAGGGLFYAKILSEHAGKLVVEVIPRSLPRGNATLLRYGQTVSLAANDTNRLFAFPREWTATQFAAATRHLFTAYIAADPGFYLSDDDPRTIKRLSGYMEKTGRMLYLSNAEMKTLASQAQDDYLYVRFVCTEATPVTPNPWLASDCAVKSTLIVPNEPFRALKNGKNTAYRWRYSDFEGYDLTIKWGGNSTLPFYLADTCDFYLSTNNRFLLIKPAVTIMRKGEYTVSAARMQEDDWVSRTDADGYFYAYFNPGNTGQVTFITSKPAEREPVYALSTISLHCVGDDIVVSVSEEQDLTLIDAAGTLVTSWHQSPADTHTITPAAGNSYRLQGKTETITINR